VNNIWLCVNPRNKTISWCVQPDAAISPLSAFRVVLEGRQKETNGLLLLQLPSLDPCAKRLIGQKLFLLRESTWY